MLIESWVVKSSSGKVVSTHTARGAASMAADRLHKKQGINVKKDGAKYSVERIKKKVIRSEPVKTTKDGAKPPVTKSEAPQSPVPPKPKSQGVRFRKKEDYERERIEREGTPLEKLNATDTASDIRGKNEREGVNRGQLSRAELRAKNFKPSPHMEKDGPEAGTYKTREDVLNKRTIDRSKFKRIDREALANAHAEYDPVSQDVKIAGYHPSDKKQELEPERQRQPIFNSPSKWRLPSFKDHVAAQRAHQMQQAASQQHAATNDNTKVQKKVHPFDFGAYRPTQADRF